MLWNNNYNLKCVNNLLQQFVFDQTYPSFLEINPGLKIIAPKKLLFYKDDSIIFCLA